MVDRLRLFLGRPLQDGDRVRLFAVAVAVVIAAAAVLRLVDDAGPEPEPTRDTRSAASRTTAMAVAVAPASTVEAPSEEGTPSEGVHADRGQVERSKRAARRFLARYLPYSYGRGPASRIPATTVELRAELAARRPRVPAAERRRRPRLELLQSDGVSRQRAELVALVRDGKRRYSLRLELANTASGWLVTGLGS